MHWKKATKTGALFLGGEFKRAGADQPGEEKLRGISTVSINILQEGAMSMEPGSCPMLGQEAQIEMKVPFKHNKSHFHHAGGLAPAQIVQRSLEVSITGDLKNPPGHRCYALSRRLE